MMRWLSRCLALALGAAPLSAQSAAPVRYEVSLSAGSTQFHVSAEFPAAGKDTLLVSLPAWSPGNYEIQNYARYVFDFGAKNATGQPLRWDRFDKDTWRIATGKTDRVTVEFDYEADTIDPSCARATRTSANSSAPTCSCSKRGSSGGPPRFASAFPAAGRSRPH